MHPTVLQVLYSIFLHALLEPSLHVLSGNIYCSSQSAVEWVRAVLFFMVRMLLTETLAKLVHWGETHLAVRQKYNTDLSVGNQFLNVLSSAKGRESLVETSESRARSGQRMSRACCELQVPSAWKAPRQLRRRMGLSRQEAPLMPWRVIFHHQNVFLLRTLC